MSKLANVWVFSDKPDRYAELLSGARQWGERVDVLLSTADAVPSVQPLGADALYVLDEKSTLQRVENYAETLVALIDKPAAQQRPATLILLAATKRGKALAARLGVLLDAAVVNDVTSFSVDDDAAYAEHRMYGGLAFGREKINTPIAVVTLAPGAVEPVSADAAHSSPVHQADYVAPRQAILCKERRSKSLSSVDLSKAKRVVGVGRGLTAQDDLRMVQALASALGAEVGCSRPIAEGEHWMERERYIGVSGVLLKSDLYLALGISGQIQHMVGGNGAKIIVAVNKDKNAPIFQYADYGLVGDIYKVVPALIEQLTQ
ncbi:MULTISPECIES: electron transfer flavoprotein subunit alpha [unclassified Brenneria]|uniref:electron transfer flavoprotein subunit alpha n=1 Tax=unclassified Brenneria TaxID=2634434 RepID=UPI0029C442B7|nr:MULTISPECIES: electron transfer flavoprotein subunit alpha [unclassified Brenneria]MDX5629805.1 electron transfer flavoprotein subunit alpha [Brenneria sp. L3-3Z]MDX5696951.1 electron transfer flavoprotein subunit alpha [Brenneria sp. L4-2C]